MASYVKIQKSDKQNFQCYQVYVFRDSGQNNLFNILIFYLTMIQLYFMYYIFNLFPCLFYLHKLNKLIGPKFIYLKGIEISVI